MRLRRSVHRTVRHASVACPVEVPLSDVARLGLWSARDMGRYRVDRPTGKQRSDERKQFVSPGNALEFVSTCMVQDESFVAGNVVACG